MSFSRTKRLLTGAGIITTTVVAMALPAAAHVTINPNTAEPGGYAAFNVRVPNEETDADTTQVQLFLPTDHPIASVSVQPVPGWTVQSVKGPLPEPIKTDDGEVTQAVTQITWSGGKIQPGQFQQFGISMGSLPTDTAKLYFKALQTYTDHSGKTHVVRWIEMPSGNTEPEHPAPSITLAKAATQQATKVVEKSSDGMGTAFGVAGLVVGLLGLGAAVFALRRSGRSTGA
ncbi:YcnI family protein [Actinoallomurus sp. NPDC052308]|uniref:YcnI family copper-binding membrane protein n=1 Tax=Actinoallomurus sp. NPDC052308 TaxID=3155530 RepID=UPI00343B3349